ncbi:Putative O-methyltransferase [Ignavibacterium album JCM 16511]|uniref:tRNA 5-hydroxyuridine methyltransferase n=1 Tax=Ignavibacterium album (strain DSM 19864 / JCM 16511 / NBRC 101810 / Mat9-16) TaxID=945713 RepID=I0AM64_IGNAJ|nr:O-methyltransferase [Ignavibacterium album]AFH50071.1 Putative O-methyltransferase [Ignavibacterium album JCM 16511]
MSRIILPLQEKYLDSFDKNKDSLLRSMEEFAEGNNVPILSNLSANLLEQLIVMNKPQRVLEIGTAIGYSTIRIARRLGRKAIIHTIEKSTDNITIAKENFKKSGLENKIKLLEGDALRIMPQLQKKYDFIFLDADKEDYKRLFDYSMVLLKKGGVIYVDNLLWHGYVAANKVPPKYKKSTSLIRDFNRIFMTQPSLSSTILPVGDGIGIGVKVL